MTTVYLAYSISGECRYTMPKLDHSRLHLLVSYYYLDHFDSQTPPVVPARTVLDSGAFSAWKSRVTIDIEALIEETKKRKWGESVALDVIGDGDASLRNALYMRSKGSPAYPVFHVGEPWALLAEYCREFPKVGLSCRFGEPVKESFKFLDGCFGRHWPHKYHSFGWVDEKALMKYPFHSADTASWNNSPSVWGRWKAFDGLPGPRGIKPLTDEVAYYWELERRLKHRWAKEMRRLDDVGRV
jgi:hypothetical protein